MTSQEHLARIRKVLDYIDQHLDDELPLEKLAEMGNYSAFHFHRIFRAVTSETFRLHHQKTHGKSCHDAFLEKRKIFRRDFLGNRIQ